MKAVVHRIKSAMSRMIRTNPENGAAVRNTIPSIESPTISANGADRTKPHPTGTGGSAENGMSQKSVVSYESIAIGRDYKIVALLASVLVGGIGLDLLAETLLHDYLFLHPDLKSFWNLLSHAFITAAIIGIVYDLLARRELEQSFQAKLDELQRGFLYAVSKEAQDIKNSLPLVVINPTQVGHLISDPMAKEMLSVLIERVCGSADIKEAMIQTISSHSKSPRIMWQNLRHALEIEPLTRKDWLWRGPEEYMELHHRMSYKTALRNPSYTFVCCRQWDDYVRYEFDPDYDAVWLMPLAFPDVKHGKRSDLFEIEAFKIGSEQLTGERIKQGNDVILYRCVLPETYRDREVSVSFVLNTILRRKAHFYRIRTTFFTRGMTVRADIHKSLTAAIKARPFLTSDVQSRTDRGQNRLWTEVATDDCIFPGQGVVIIWE
jgi:hypothetical protein